MESNEETAQPTVGALPDRKAESKARPTITVSIVLMAAALVFLAFDFSQIIFARGHRAEALAMIPAQTRITQVERKLNEAGYLTLYMEGPPAALQVSTLRRHPLTAQFLHKILPKSPPDRWLRDAMSRSTRFFVVADTEDYVRRDTNGSPQVYYTAPGQPERIGGF